MPGATTIDNFNEGVILASEKRVTYGGFVMSRGGKKVFNVTDELVLPVQA
jgi:proteasome beta subunit